MGDQRRHLIDEDIPLDVVWWSWKRDLSRAGGVNLRETENRRYDDIVGVLGSGISGGGGDAGCMADDRADFYSVLR